MRRGARVGWRGVAVRAGGLDVEDEAGSNPALVVVGEAIVTSGKTERAKRATGQVVEYRLVRPEKRECLEVVAAQDPVWHEPYEWCQGARRQSDIINKWQTSGNRGVIKWQ